MVTTLKRKKWGTEIVSELERGKQNVESVICFSFNFFFCCAKTKKEMNKFHWIHKQKKKEKEKEKCLIKEI